MVAETEVNLGGASADFMAATADVPETLGPVDPIAQPGQGGELQQQPQPIGGLSIEAIEMTLGMVFAMVAARIGEDGQFWELNPEEKRNLATVWHPILSPLWQKWMADTDGAIVAAVACTAVTIAPRLMRETARRASLTASTGTARSGASSLLQGQPGQANQPRPIG